MASYCPVTGASVFTRPTWTNQVVSDSFTADFSVVNGSVIYSQPKGRAHIEGVRKSMAINDTVGEFVARSNGPYVQIEDYAFMFGSRSDARRCFTEWMNQNQNLSTLIFCNLSPALAIAVNIGKRLNTSGKDIYVVKDYSAAIKLALSLDDQETRAPAVPPIDLSEYYKSTLPVLSPVDLLVDPAWDIRTPEFSLRSVVIDQSILHTTSQGYLETRQVPVIDGFRDRCRAALKAGASIEYIVVDSSRLTGSNRRARTEYMKSLASCHRRYPFRMYIGYGTNTFMKTALLLAATRMPFKVKIAKDIGHAFQLIHDDRAAGPSVNETISGSEKPYVVERLDMERLLAFIGGINWEAQGIDQSLDIPGDHPLFFLYQSIRLIKEEIDELFVERKRFEEQLHQSRKMESVGTLAAGVAHDFNNFLHMIVGNTELALQETPRASSVHSNLEDIKDAAFKAKGVVRQLLEFSRSSERKYEPIDVVPVIKDALRLLRASSPASVELREDLPDSRVTITGDPTQINQVLMNLVTNAVQALGQSGGSVEVRAVRESAFDGTHDVSGNTASGDYLKLTVTDDGPGIDARYLDRIFDPYFTTKGFGKGFGMGLAVVLGIVKNHGGTIAVDSKPGGGTTFSLRFPILDRSSPRTIEPQVEMPVGSESILFVEDEESVVRMMRRMLERLGYELETSANPTEALDLFRSRPHCFDLVMTDMTMPQMTGLELAARMKEIRTDIPVILCTGNKTLIDEVNTAETGISALVVKPVKLQKLATTIRTVLDQRFLPSDRPGFWPDSGHGSATGLSQSPHREIRLNGE